MSRVQQKQVQRLHIISQQRTDIITQNCGAFIDFFSNINTKGRILECLGTSLNDTIKQIEDSQDHVIQMSPKNGLQCNMIFGVCIDPKLFDSKKFSDNDFRRCVLDALVECFKNCVDSIVINCSQLKTILKSFNVKNPIKCVMEALKYFYTGEVVDEAGHQYSKRFVGKIYIFCENDEELKKYEKEKSVFGNLVGEKPADQQIRFGQFGQNVNSLQKATNDFYSEKTMVGNYRIDDFVTVQARLSSLESTLKILEMLVTEYDSF